MPSDLATYLHDHHAGATFALELLGSLAEQDADPELSAFAVSIRAEIQEDASLLQAAIDQVGEGDATIKKALGHLAEKALRVKFNPSEPRGLGTFEVLETLSLGIFGKRALWRVLQQAGPGGLGLGWLDLADLIARAETQYDRVEEWRLQVGAALLRRLSQL